MQRQLPVTFSYITSDHVVLVNPEAKDPNERYQEGPNETVTHTVMVVMELSRSKKTVIRARGSWDGDLHTVVKEVPIPDFPPSNQLAEQHNWADNHYFWDWMRYGAVLAILEIFLEDEIYYDDTEYFREMLPQPVYWKGSGQRPEDKNPQYFKLLEQLAAPIKFWIIDNGF